MRFAQNLLSGTAIIYFILFHEKGNMAILIFQLSAILNMTFIYYLHFHSIHAM